MVGLICAARPHPPKCCSSAHHAVLLSSLPDLHVRRSSPPCHRSSSFFFFTPSRLLCTFQMAVLTITPPPPPILSPIPLACTCSQTRQDGKTSPLVFSPLCLCLSATPKPSSKFSTLPPLDVHAHSFLSSLALLLCWVAVKWQPPKNSLLPPLCAYINISTGLSDRPPLLHPT